jgi:hypothetical protein
MEEEEEEEKHLLLRGPIVRGEKSPESGMPQLEDSSIISCKDQ